MDVNQPSQRARIKLADGGETSSRNKEIAQTILNQIGGINRLVAFTGAYNFVAINNGVSFRIKNPKANYIKITLNGKDLYDLEVGRIRGTDYKVVGEQSDLYYDMLKSEIEKFTGMYLSFAKGGKLKSRANYIPNRDIEEVEVSQKGKTRFIDGADIFDGIYVKKKGSKFAKGGKVGNSYTASGENYSYTNTFGVDQDDFIKLVDVYHNTNPEEQFDRIVERLTYREFASKYGDSKLHDVMNYIHQTHSIHEKYAQGGEVHTMSAKDRARLDELQLKENDDRLTKAENIEYDKLVKEYKTTKEYKHYGKYAKGGELDEAKIYVADLSEYNNGRLVGKWLNLSDYSSGAEVMEAIQEMLDEQTKKDKYGDVHEEYAIHDFEGFPRSFYSEYMGESDFDALYEMMRIADSSNLPLDVLMEAVSDLGYEDNAERVAEAYYSSIPASMGNEFRDFAYEYIDSIGSITDAVSNPEFYFDYERFGSDIRMEYSNEEFEEMGYTELYISDEELGEQMADDMGGVENLGQKTIEMYFDYDMFGRDLEYDFIAVRGKDGDYYFFNRNFAKGGKVKYAKGGEVGSIDFDFSFDTDGDYEDRDVEVEKIKYLRTKIDFDQVRGDIDYRREENNTNLRFFKNGELVMRIKGDGTPNGVNAEISAYGYIGYLNYHPQDGLGGLNMFEFKREVNRVFEDFSEENKQFAKGGEVEISIEEKKKSLRGNPTIKF